MSTTDPFSLVTPTPEAGFDLALKLSRLAVKAVQPSAEVRAELRAVYERDTAQLIAVSQVAAIHFQTIAAANGYWRTQGASARTANFLPRPNGMSRNG